MCTNNILVKEQYGFRINSSKYAASYSVIDEILKAVNNRPSVGEIFCDLDKALDCKTLSDIISWIKANFLLLNFNKTYCLEFRTKNCIETTSDINYIRY
jgi:hypothetical protein